MKRNTSFGPCFSPPSLSVLLPLSPFPSLLPLPPSSLPLLSLLSSPLRCPPFTPPRCLSHSLPACSFSFLSPAYRALFIPPPSAGLFLSFPFLLFSVLTAFLLPDFPCTRARASLVLTPCVQSPFRCLVLSFLSFLSALFLFCFGLSILSGATRLLQPVFHR